jgi:hypothetical protein
MQWDWSIKVTDLAIVFATLVGPILAVQAQKWIERKNATTVERQRIFRALMATRARALDPAHVEALNAIPIAFYGDSRPLQEVTGAWRALLQHFNTATTNTWEETRITLEMDLLQKIAKVLNYDFPDRDMRNVYFPTAHGNTLAEQDIIRQGLAKLFGGGALPIELRASNDVLEEQEALRRGLKSLASGESALRVEVTSPENK